MMLTSIRCVDDRALTIFYAPTLLVRHII